MPVIKETQKCHKRIRSCTGWKEGYNGVENNSKPFGLAVSLKTLPLMTPCGRCIKTELKDTNRNERGKLSSGIEQQEEEEE